MPMFERITKGLEFVDEASGTAAVDSIDFVGLDGQTDRIYLLYVRYGCIGGGNYSRASIRFGYGSAPTWDASANHYSWLYLFFGTNQYSNFDTQIVLNNNETLNTTGIFSSEMQIICPSVTMEKTLHHNSYGFNTDGTGAVWTGRGGGSWRDTTNNLTAIRFVDLQAANNIKNYYACLFRRRV